MPLLTWFLSVALITYHILLNSLTPFVSISLLLSCELFQGRFFFSCFVNCYISGAWNISWHIADPQLMLVEWKHKISIHLWEAVPRTLRLVGLVAVFKIFICLFLAVLGLHCCKGFSLIAEWRLLSSWDAWTCVDGLSCCWAWALGHAASVIMTPAF